MLVYRLTHKDQIRQDNTRTWGGAYI